jgi:hypothetical protein
MTTPVDPVALVELKIERRRAQLLRDWNGARDYVTRKNRWAPLAAVAAIAALGFGLARPRPASLAAGQPGAARRGILAALLATLSSGLRFALSPAGRTLWASLNGARGRRY